MFSPPRDGLGLVHNGLCQLASSIRAQDWYVNPIILEHCVPSQHRAARPEAAIHNDTAPQPKYTVNIVICPHFAT